MIPLRVKMAGFLSYKGEQEIDFGSASLWMLAGTNGSGKSSVFDALTYALFGSHRGGSSNAVELINKESPGANVEFDFRLDGSVYRVKRTIRRTNKGAGSGTQQVFQEAAAGVWHAVPDTTKKVDFDRWIGDKIGLSYETFTSSVLLLQGKAERLLDAKASDRAEVLASIVDLDRYQRLHARANDYKLEYKNRLEAVSHRTSAVPDVSDMEYHAAVLDIDGREDDRKICQVEIEKLLNLEVQCRRWLDAQNRYSVALTKLKTSEGLLSDAVKIELAHQRYTELRLVLPAVSVVLTMRANFRESLKRTERFLQQRVETQDRKRQTDAAHELARKARAELARQLASDEAKFAAVNARLRELAGTIETVKLVEQQQAELARHEADLKRQPADPEAALSAAQHEVERLTELTRVLPILERVQTERHDLGKAAEAERAETLALAATKTEGADQGKIATALTTELTAGRQARAEAEQRVAVTKSLEKQAKDAAEEFDSLSGAKDCRACGQPLTPAHFAAEQAKRRAGVQAAQRDHAAARQQLAEATRAEADLAQREQAGKDKLVALRERYVALTGEVKQHREATKRLAGSLALRYAELPADYQARVAAVAPADWTTTRYPERDELVGLRQDAAKFAAAKKGLAAARDALTAVGTLRTRVESANATVARLKQTLAGIDPVKVREEHQTLAATEKGLLNGIKAGKSGIVEHDSSIDKLGAESHNCTHTLTDLSGKLVNEDTVRKNAEENANRAKRELPESWQVTVEAAGLGSDSGWKAEAERLAADGIEKQFQGLAHARAGLENLRDALRTQEAEVEAFDPEARRSPDEVRALVTEAKGHLAHKEEAHLAALQHRGKLDDYRTQRAALGTEYRALDAKFSRYKTVAELLGRDRLQRYLVRQAERQIVEFANGVLDRLSGGQLSLQLVAHEESTTEKALELEAFNRVTGGSPINVAFLSGSQKFRVAVCLALGIGQYASRQHRPIESVIIDEGFGCLDRQGRQVMIQELQNLRGHLHCILLVSHQEEFADAFADGYRFELHDGATKVIRFQR